MKFNRNSRWLYIAYGSLLLVSYLIVETKPYFPVFMILFPVTIIINEWDIQKYTQGGKKG